MVRRRIYLDDVCTHCPPPTKNTLANMKDVHLTKYLIGVAKFVQINRPVPLCQYFRNMSQVSVREITYPFVKH